MITQATSESRRRNVDASAGRTTDGQPQVDGSLSAR